MFNLYLRSPCLIVNKSTFSTQILLKCMSSLLIIHGPRQGNLVLIAYASSEGSGEPAHPPEPPLLAHTAVNQEEPSDRKPDHDGMLEDTNSHDGAHIISGIFLKISKFSTTSAQFMRTLIYLPS